MKASKTYTLITFCVAALVLMLLPALNMYIDSARVLTQSFDTEYKDREPNVAFLRMAYLLENNEHYDGIVFGSSRTRYGVDADYVGRLFGGKWYKAEYPGGTQREHLHNLKLLIEHDRSPQHVIVMLDDFVLHRHIDTKSDYFYRLYPNSLFDWFDFYRFYLFKRPSEMDWKIAFGRAPLRPYDRIRSERRGGIFFQSGAKDENPDVISVRYRPKRVLSAPPFGSNNMDKPDRMESVLEELEQLRKLCADNQIKMTLVMTPRHYKTLFAKDVNLLTEFRERLSAKMPYFDFSPLSEASMDNRHWREASHFFASLGNRAFDEVASVEVEGKPSTRFVTAEFAKAHVQSMRAGLHQNLIALLRQDPRMSLHRSYLSLGSSVRYDAPISGGIEVDGQSLARSNAQVMKISLRSKKGINLKVFATVRNGDGLVRRLTVYDFALAAGRQDVWAALPDADQGLLTQIAFETDREKVLINHIELFALADLQTN